MSIRTRLAATTIAAASTLAGCQSADHVDADGVSGMRVHYLEVVSGEADAQIAGFEGVHGLSFGPPVADLGQARVAEAPDGSLVGVRAPMAPQEAPTMRTYLEVQDIAAAVRAAEAAGAVIAYPPTTQGDTGTWAIYILDGVQFGLWQK